VGDGLPGGREPGGKAEQGLRPREARKLDTRDYRGTQLTAASARKHCLHLQLEIRWIWQGRSEHSARLGLQGSGSAPSCESEVGTKG